MSIRVLPTRDTFANDYAALAPFLAGFTGDPGTAGLATNEITGGSPVYNRANLGWTTSSGGAGVVNGSASINVPAGDTVQFVGVCASGTPGTNDVKDNVAVTSQFFASQGVYSVNASFTQG